MKEKLKDYHILFVALVIVRNRFFYFLNKMSNYRLEKINFYRKLGYPLNLKNPKSYNEKIIWKKIHDRNPLLVITSDKYEVRSYVKKTLGEEKAQKILIPLLFVTDQPETIPFEKLPSSFIIKPNHASGKKIIVENGHYNRENTINICRRWLKTPYGMDKLEWAYQPIKRKIVIEQLLQKDDGTAPERYYFQIFHGKCKAVFALIKDKINGFSVTAFDEKWTYLSLKSSGFPQKPEIKKPKNYETMLEIAEKLSKPFDHVRVDLYNINGKIYFGELTHYSVSGKMAFEPRTFDFAFGSYWKIEPGY